MERKNVNLNNALKVLQEGRKSNNYIMEVLKSKAHKLEEPAEVWKQLEEELHQTHKHEIIPFLQKAAKVE